MSNYEAMDMARKYIVKNPDVKPPELQEKFGVSRASSYNLIRDAKKAAPVVAKTVSRGEVDAKPKKKKTARRRRKQYGDIHMDEIPEYLRKLPELTLDGFALMNGDKAVKTPDGVEWGDRVYVGACPCCLKSVHTFHSKSKKGVVSYTGKCITCNIAISISSVIE